ncbi:general transcription factor II-I repeat domain-containing protein 2B-like [Centruroides vittatus]|uniref:general transcription factor II-I repeat domain-containing protein 2B-like n=1 Tax=Centruroides vittatus TaxID=120091 RepID=UPI00351079D2
MAQAFNDNEMVRKFQTVSLSHQTVSRRVNEISMHVTNKLENLINSCCYFSVALDESTDISDTSQMLIFIRTVNENYNYSEELLKLQSLHGTTKGEDIYKQLKCAVEQYGGFDKCTAIVTDGARAMTGKNIGLAGLLQKEGITCRMLHCIIHQEALCGLSLQLKDVMDKVCKITNLIRGGNRSLTHRKFKTFLDELETEYGDLLLHSNVRWLSVGKCLRRFFTLRKEVHLFLTEIAVDENLTANLVDKNFIYSLAFLTDITNYLNILNKSLQGQDQNVCCLYKYVTGFRNKLKLLRFNLEQNNLFHFESCKEIYEEMKECNIEANFKIFLPKLDMLITDFNERFSQFDDLKPSIDLFCDPINIDINSVDLKYQIELCDLQADPFFTSRGVTGIEIFKFLDKEKYPKLRDFGLQIVSMFGSTYICERAYSDMKYIKSKYRNSLKDSTLEDIIRLATTNIDVDIKDIVAKQLRPQCSH